ncbi:uncharacterized protein LOC117330207 [Pecten maximus]|uniref:uncharacterized protein LOC117330207 n=1 Tax=Pecten maximus TaxID=6579 RepID=UPI001458B548|nr:uncharacterized protein LOC117330207 [Pecten maximus]
MSALPETSLICKNLKSATSEPDIVDELITSEVNKKFLIGPYTEPPFDIYRINPIGIATGKYSDKKRLIVDLSAPHDSEGNSINELIAKEEYSLSYISVDDAINQIQHTGRHSKLCKLDITDAFKLIPVSPKLWPFYGICWKQQYYFYTKLTFGCRSSPKIFDLLSTALCWILSTNYQIEYIIHYLDDFLTIDRPNVVAERTMAILSKVFTALNIPVSPHKTLGPSESLEFLGITLDTSNMEARLPANKVQRITQTIKSFCKRKKVTKRELLSLLGHMNFASRVIIQGRSFISYLLNLAASVKQLHHHVQLTGACQQDLFMWYTFTDQWNGNSVFLQETTTLAHDINLYTDAAGGIGFGAFYDGQWFHGHWPHQISLNSSEMSIAFMELYPIVLACMIWGHKWSGLRIRLHCDNQATVDIIRKGRSKCAYIMPFMRRLTWCTFIHNFVLTAVHIPGKQNNIADALSRFQMDRFHDLAPAAKKSQNPIPDYDNVPLY